MIQNKTVIDFLAKIDHSIKNDVFVKLTLSKPLKDTTPKKIYLKPVLIKNILHLSATFHFTTRDETHNFLPSEIEKKLGEWLQNDYKKADLFTTNEEANLLFNKKREATLLTRKNAEIREKPSLQHNHTKATFIKESTPFLHDLGLSNTQGQILPTGQKKFKQIRKYLEIVDSLLKDHPLPDNPHIADMGAGKGYLTFALYEYLENKGVKAIITGIESRPSLVEQCNEIARKVGYDRLNFIQGEIGDFKEPLDMLIALHACDTATDDAIFAGISSKAALILVAPCCHKQIRKSLLTQPGLQPVTRFGIMEERLAEWLTDGIRALLMEGAGYKTQIMQFIETEHTPKNLLIAGVKGKSDPKAPEKIQELKKQFGVKEHYLEKLLHV